MITENDEVYGSLYKTLADQICETMDDYRSYRLSRHREATEDDSLYEIIADKICHEIDHFRSFCLTFLREVFEIGKVLTQKNIELEVVRQKKMELKLLEKRLQGEFPGLRLRSVRKERFSAASSVKEKKEEKPLELIGTSKL